MYFFFFRVDGHEVIERKREVRGGGGGGELD